MHSISRRSILHQRQVALLPVLSLTSCHCSLLFCSTLRMSGIAYMQELQMAGINFKAFDLGGHEIARRVWKDYYAKVCTTRRLCVNLT